MIKALAWSMRQHPDTITSLEKLVLIGLSDMCDDEQIVRVSVIKLTKFAGIDNDVVEECLTKLAAKGFIKCLDDEEGFECMPCYKLIITR
jgi:hypothetical protein